MSIAQSALQTMLRRRHNLHFCWKAGAHFRIPMDQPTLRLSLHRGVWSGTGGFYTKRREQKRLYFGIYDMAIVYAFVVYKVDKTMV